MSNQLYKTQWSKAEVIRELHAMIVDRLFGGGPYLVDRDTEWALDIKLFEMGLEEPCPEGGCATPMGNELKIDLLRAFMGAWYVYQVREVFLEYRLISEEEATEIYDRIECEEDPEVVLPHYVRLAYMRYFNPTNAVN